MILRVTGAVIALTFLGIAAALAFVYSGIYNVSAMTPHTRLIAWTVHQVYEHSVDRRAAAIDMPTDLEADAAVHSGAKLYDATCVACHGAPGRPLGPVGTGINPQAPALLSASRKNQPKPLFWVVKNGVKMTGMPAFGRSFEDQQIWDIVAFLAKDKGITPEAYEALIAKP